MKKILLPFEGANYPGEILEFAHNLHALSPFMLAAAFVPEVDYANFGNLPAGVGGAVYSPATIDEDPVIEKNGALLEAFCREHRIKYAQHTDRLDFALPSIRKESRFADLMLLSSIHFFENISSDQPNAYMKEILHSAECPVLLLPENPGLPETLILTYDGTASSVYALKQFAGLFPELSGIPAQLVCIQDKVEEPLPDEMLIEEWASQHFKDLHVKKLSMQPHVFFNNWLFGKTKPWVITGSYGRSGLSLLFAKSFITDLIKIHRIPVFIAHP
jgi:hypothetical protein